MRPFFGFKAGRAVNASEDGAIAEKMRGLALEIHTDGRAKLSLSAGEARRLRRLNDEAARLRATSLRENDSLARLCREAKLTESCATQARAESARDLPAASGRPRILLVAEKLCGSGTTRLTKDRLMLAMASFDEVQPLKMAELWAVPEAVRVATAKGILDVAEEILDMARERESARRWVAGRSVSLRGRGSVFFECASQLSEEAEDDAKRAILGKCDLDRVLRDAHERESLALLRLDNLLAAKRLADSLQWEKCFEELSAVEAELCCDPSEVYPNMEDASRAAVRRETAAMARRCGLSELTVARYAVRAAQNDEAHSTVCYWLYDDEGRRALMSRMASDARLPKMIPDPTGRKSIAGILLLTAAFWTAFALATDSPLFWALGIPIAWSAANAVIGRFFPRFVKPCRLLKMKMKRVPPELRTLVTMPVLLSSEERARQVCEQIESLGCLEKDGNIRYLILGDFADADAENMPSDERITALVRRCVTEMNRRAGEKKYFYLHRPRTFLEIDRRWMGRDRKRGALTDLNALILGKAGAEEAFAADSTDAAFVREQFRYVLTVDADTRFLPGAARRLIGTMAHPLNARYAVLQPQMELSARGCVNDFVRLFGGRGGMSAYPSSVSGFWQDVTGRGLFGGKGLYDVRVFDAALDGALPEGRILSHDMIEGALAGAAAVSDVCFFDEHPSTLSSFMRRLHRWTRGDWQLLPMLFSKKIDGLTRLHIADNLLRSLFAPSIMALLTQAIWFGNEAALVTGLAAAYMLPILRPLAKDDPWRRATAELAILPVTAAYEMDAVLRTLWRVLVSGKSLLDWTTAADAEGKAGKLKLPCRIATILLLPGLLVTGMTPAVAALGALFCIAPEWIHDMEQARTEENPKLPADRTREMMMLARDTWRFFEDNVGPKSHYLPPDNVQLDPAAGVARRTSPTNIGLYLMSCVAAWRLDLISKQMAFRRIEDTVRTVESMEKWRGHLYNWIDIDTAEPMKPRYVSSVDSGNLAAALLLCAAATEDAELSERMRKIAENMDFRALYDGERALFVIGFDAERGQNSESYYDLLASESRILSYTAMMLGQVPERHWSKLSRACVNACGEAVAVSWSGTMFEYLMPELFFHAPSETLLGRTARGAVRAQRVYGEKWHHPWGVSESGYCAFDLNMNYQYRAFGLRALALSGSATGGVIAPYAAALALTVDADGASQNLMDMKKRGWYGRYGLYEAVDFRDGTPKTVRSYMAHHQGMTLCAICNALTERSLNGYFMKHPEARALMLLLEEKPAESAKNRIETREGTAMPMENGGDERAARTDRRILETQLLFGGGATVLCTADGAAHYSKDGIDATRFDGGLTERPHAAQVHILRESTGETSVAAGTVRFSGGGMCCKGAVGAIRYEMKLGVSPEDGTLFKVVTLWNDSPMRETVRVADCVPVALGAAADVNAHPVFRNLFVESERLSPCVTLLRRRPRSREERCPVLLHLVSSPEGAAALTDLDKLTGRTGALRWDWNGEDTGLNPCSALQTRLTLASGQKTEIFFAMGLTEEREAIRWVERNRCESAPERALRLAAMRARAMSDYLRLDARKLRVLHRYAAMLFDPKLAREGAEAYRAWTVAVRDAGELDNLRELFRAHAFYHSMGIEIALTVICDEGNDYARPLRDALTRCMPAGTRISEGTEEKDAPTFDASEDFYTQLRRKLSALECPEREIQVIDAGENRLPPAQYALKCGFGGFLTDGSYAMDVDSAHLPPAAWCNFMANERFGVMLTERGGGFAWSGSSRDGRLTPFRNDPLREGWGWMFYLQDEDGAFLRLLPGERPQMPFRVTYGAAETVYRFECERFSGETALCVCEDKSELRIHMTLRSAQGGSFRLTGFVDWLMGTALEDARLLKTETFGGACFASGAMPGVGYFAASDVNVRSFGERTAFLGRGTIQSPEGLGMARGGGWGLEIPVRLEKNTPKRFDFVLGWAEELRFARQNVRRFAGDPDYEAARRLSSDGWKCRNERLVVETPDAAVNLLANGWLMRQTLTCRIFARTGLYQPGGAYGFRDQLQDMLALLPSEPRHVRRHLLLCAVHQFEDGDVMHWWHPPFRGVRTRVSDDLLFLPFVTACYLRRTNDVAVLEERAAFLRNVEIPEGKEDIYGEMQPSEDIGTLHEHCMRAFRHAAQRGSRGLLKMGSGDWNDGMNRVGASGEGESVWLSEFCAVCAAMYAEWVSGEERDWLISLSEELKAAVERHGWDGAWYLRAFADDGTALGSSRGEVCRIDAISQAWAQLARLDEERCGTALDSAWEMLADPRGNLIRLLTPPFRTDGTDAGYICGYPEGVRENGGQYTHGALWLLLALIDRGDAERAHRALQMLLPINHARDSVAVERYRVEPYVMAADVYDGRYAGRGGWTWYTGSAGWMYLSILMLLGFERRGDEVRLSALLGEWEEAAVTVTFGMSRYRLVCRRDVQRVTLDGIETDADFVRMIDDGKLHEALFPQRKASCRD